MKIKLKCDGCGLISKIPPTLHESVYNGDDVYLDNNCPRCDGQRFSVIDKNPPPSVIITGLSTQRDRINVTPETLF